MPYIHELPDWPHLTWRDDEVAMRVRRTRINQGRLAGLMQALGFKIRSEAMLEAMTLDAMKTSEIEGEILEHEQVRSSVARRLGIDTEFTVPVDRAVEGLVEMLIDATRNYSVPLTPERLFAWHRGLFSEKEGQWMSISVGAWRDDRLGAMQVVSGNAGRENVHFQAPSATRVDFEMQRFFAWVNDTAASDPLIHAALAHLYFVTVHPFDDGNGRIARAIADWALARSEQSPYRFYSMSARIRKERSDYYSILERTQKGGLDVTEWIVWFLSCLNRAINDTETMVHFALRKAKFWQDHASLSFNARQTLMINKLLDGFEGKLTSSKWAKIAKCSQDTATRDIQDLITKSVLRKEASGGRSTSYILAS